MRVLYALLCQRAIIDRDSNNVSIFNVIEEMGIPPQEALTVSSNTPVQFGHLIGFELLALWARTAEDVPEEGTGRLQLFLPDRDEALITRTFPLDLSQFLRTRQPIAFPGLPEAVGGTYRFVLSVSSNGEWEWQFEVPLRVVVQPEEP